jgi:hypothetical protein
MIKAELFGARLVRPDGVEMVTTVARGNDGSFWMQVGFLGLSAERMGLIRRVHPESVQREPRSGEWFVEMRAAISQAPTEEEQVELMLTALEYRAIVDERFPGNSGG